MLNTTTRAVHAVTLEFEGYTVLAFFGGDMDASAPLGDYERDAYIAGRLIPAARPVRPVRCYEGARS